MIELEKLSTADLAKLISAAMNEYQRRLSEPSLIAAPEPIPQVVIAPTEVEKSHVASCLRLLKTGGVIRADVMMLKSLNCRTGSLGKVVT